MFGAATTTDNAVALLKDLGLGEEQVSNNLKT